MSERVAKAKGPVNNINISINLKVQAKDNLAGRKINNQKELVPKSAEINRANITTESLRTKKTSMRDNHAKHKRSLIEFIEETTNNYEREEDE